ncbi:hypothetical protein KDW_49280 [Dictyobacter vulcani]|uniref:Uncharacterized protein n=1 Tax=Dictyobacter vulcani TaxID=2607529 RepID=A0A5J4KZV5_9CHLR|nr:hypothetical protein [Dictyobacter vulcani]GER90766.1 hypothetical protein KDW_49280 [Dictyobacter vulcani]
MAIFVRSPITGATWSLATYCNASGNPPHTIVNPWQGWQNPINVGGAHAGDAMWWYADNGNGGATFASFTTTQFTGVCAVDPAPWTNGVIVRLYDQQNGQGNHVASIMFGHVANRCSDSVVNTYGRAVAWQIGNFTTDCQCGCYYGIHVHMQQWNGTQNSNLYCNRPVNQDLDALYIWNTP